MSLPRGWPWPAAVVVILALTVAANVWVIHLATSDPTFAVEPDYYRRAVAWDGAQAQQAQNARLAWRVDAELGPLAGAGGATELRVRLVDAAGAPVAGAAVRVEAAHAHVREPLAGVLEELPDQSYRVALPLARGGLWQLRFTARRAQAVFTAEARVDAGPA